MASNNVMSILEAWSQLASLQNTPSITTTSHNQICNIN